MPQFNVSNRQFKKYSVITPAGRTLHFGDTRYKHYKDTTGLKHYSHLDHGDKNRRERYLVRAKGIKNKHCELTYLDPESANYYSVKYLW